MKKDILFANGCSFTWGGALEPWFMFVDDKPLGDIIGYDATDFRTPDGNLGVENTKVREKIVWPHHLGQLLNCNKVINSGIGCGSNQRIIRTTLEWLSSQNRETLDRTVAVIQMTEPSRYEYYDEENNLWARCKVDVCQQIAEKQEIADARNMSRLSTFTTNEGIFEYVRDCMALNQIFSFHNVNYFLWSMINPFHNTNHDFINLNKIIDECCTWINHTQDSSSYGALESLKANNGKITTAPSSIHPGVEGHKELAEILHFYIQANS